MGRKKADRAAFTESLIIAKSADSRLKAEVGLTTSLYETDPLTCPKCRREMRIISFISPARGDQKTIDRL
jgi:hypothetical protein